MPRRRSEYRPPLLPRNSELVRQYPALGRELWRFLGGAMKLLIIVGPRGTGKSEAVKMAMRAFAADARFLNCPGRPWRLYMELFSAANRIIVLNEARALFKNPHSLDLLKTATERAVVNLVQWGYSTPAEIRAGEIPSEFTTTSRFVILCNSWPEADPDIDAIQSRATVIYFTPSAREMHRYAGTWYEGRRDVYDFMGLHLAECEEPDLRYYKEANDRAEWAAKIGLAESYWQDYVLGLAFAGDTKVAWQLMNDRGFDSDHQRAKEFARLTGASERKFYRLRDQLKSRMDAPRDKAAGTCQTVKLLGYHNVH